MPRPHDVLNMAPTNTKQERASVQTQSRSRKKDRDTIATLARFHELLGNQLVPTIARALHDRGDSAMEVEDLISVGNSALLTSARDYEAAPVALPYPLFAEHAVLRTLVEALRTPTNMFVAEEGLAQVSDLY